ncbi:porin [Actinoplanes sp. NPDC049681]|uniref:LppU/SCO3897 family protein n=1 Tax=Actinoplanes sp. NPDC049681 TaxID=3363905 RepID=UPI0037AAD0EB
MRERHLAAAVVVLAVAVTVGVLSAGEDEAKDAAVGDCLATSARVRQGEDAQADATVVGCSQASAAYTVVGRVDGQSDSRSRACESFFAADEEYFVYSSTAGDGYLLCLRRVG